MKKERTEEKETEQISQNVDSFDISIASELKKIGLAVIYIVLLIFLIRFFHLKQFEIILMLWVTTFGFKLYTYRNEDSLPVRGLLFTMGYIAIFVYAMFWLGNYGIYGYLLSIAIIVFAILWMKRKKYMAVKHHIEGMIWGEPLYQFRQRGQKPPKLEIDWAGSLPKRTKK